MEASVSFEISVFSCILQGFMYIYIVTNFRKSHRNFKLNNENLGCAIYFQSLSIPNVHRYAPHNDVSVNDGPHIRWWSHNILM